MGVFYVILVIVVVFEIVVIYFCHLFNFLFHFRSLIILNTDYYAYKLCSYDLLFILIFWVFFFHIGIFYQLIKYILNKLLYFANIFLIF
jgi:hypothetical protein